MAFFAITRAVDYIARICQGLFQQALQILVILYQQNAHGTSIAASVPEMPFMSAVSAPAAAVTMVSAPATTSRAIAGPLSRRSAHFATFKTVSSPVGPTIVRHHSVVRNLALLWTVEVKIVPPTALAENAAVACVRVEPDNAPLGRHPLQPVVDLTVGTLKRTFGVIETARVTAANLRKDMVERKHGATVVVIPALPLVVKLRLGGSGREHCANQPEGPYEHGGTHRVFLSIRK